MLCTWSADEIESTQVPSIRRWRVTCTRARRGYMATKKKSSASAATGKSKVKKTMHEFKHGELKSGTGAKVKSKKQAVAIGLSEARREGAKIPRKKAAAKH